MSAPLNLTAGQLRNLGHALDMLTAMTHTFGVSLTPYQRLDLGIGGNVIHASWDDEKQAYVIDDRNGE